MTIAGAVASADSNWFLSTVAQVSATLVAIIGGFLVTRVLAVSGERRSLTLQRDALGARLEAMATERAGLEEDTFRDDWLPWLEAVMLGIARSRCQVTVEEALEAEGCSRSTDELRPVFDRAKEEVAAAFDELEGAFVPGQPPPPDLEEMIDLSSLDEVARSAHWAVYIYLTEELAKTPSMWAVIPFSHRPPPARAPEFEVEDLRVRREKEDHIRDLRSTERILGEHRAQLEDALAASAQLAGAGAAAGILSYLAIVGVFWPLLVMARLDTHISDSVAWVTLGLLTLGLGLVIGYIVWALKHR